jgi:hypothetical protein
MLFRLRCQCSRCFQNTNASNDSSKIINAAADRVSVTSVKAAIASNANASEDGAKNISATA